jgi:hypothetical protein
MARTIPTLLVFFLPLVVYGQSTTGNLEGWIFDVNGAAIVGAEVTVTSADLQGVRGISSDERGFFRLLALPSGKYTVKIRHVSYQPENVGNVRIRLGQTTTLAEVKLQSATVQMAEVVVSGQRPLLDPASTTGGANLTRESFEVLPIERNYRTMASMLPQANQSYFGDEVNISGSTGAENVYIVDGMNVTDPMWGVTNANLPYNFIKEVQVKSGGYEAEYGRALGGIMNVITHSGGNEFQGQVFGFYSNQALQSNPKIGLGDTKFEESSQYDMGFSIGGPVVPDKLWFYAAYNPTFDSRVVSFPGSGPLRDDSKRHLFAGKLTWRVSSSSGVVLSLLGDPYQRDKSGSSGFLGFTGAVANLDPLLGRITQGGTAVSLQSHHTLGSDAIINFLVCRIDREDDDAPRNWSGSGSVPARQDDYVNGVTSGGYGGLSKRKISRTTLEGSLSLALNTHVLKIGVEYEDLFFDDKSDFSVVMRYVDTVFTWFRNVGSSNVHNRAPAVYLQDSWPLTDRLRLNLGLRWDGQYFVNGNGEVAQSITDQFQPRFGFTYLLGELGTQKLFGSAGRFFEQIPVQPIGSWYGTWCQSIVNYSHNPLIDSRGGDTSSVVYGTPMPNVPGLRGEYFDEVSLGYEHLLMAEYKFGIRGVFRILRSAIEDAIGPDGVIRMGNPGKGDLSYLPEAYRRYTALEVTIERPADVGLSFIASYVLSRNYGNYTGLTATDLTSFGSNAGPQFDFFEQTPKSGGLLPNDKTHVFKFFGTYRFDSGFSTGLGFLWQSGMPLNEYGGIPAGAPYWSFVQPRGSAGRAPANWDLSLRCTYDLQNMISTNLKPRMILDFSHVGNPQTPVTYDQVHYTAVDEQGNQLNPNPNYGRVTHYQPPMSVRLGLEVGF